MVLNHLSVQGCAQGAVHIDHHHHDKGKVEVDGMYERLPLSDEEPGGIHDLFNEGA